MLVSAASEAARPAPYCSPRGESNPMKLDRLFLPITLLAATGGAFAQGADDCAQATAINGPGPHAFDNTGATDSGIIPTCVNIVQDVWFAWTAPSTGPFILQTCG